MLQSILNKIVLILNQLFYCNDDTKHEVMHSYELDQHRSINKQHQDHESSEIEETKKIQQQV